MLEVKAFAEEAAVSTIAEEAIFSYLHKIGAPIEQLKALATVSLVPNTQKLPWLQTAVFMGQNDIRIISQSEGKQATSLMFETNSDHSFRTTHNVVFAAQAPTFQDSDFEPPYRATTSILSQRQTEMELGSDAYKKPFIVFDGVAPKKVHANGQYRVKNGIFVFIPEEVQEELNIHLETEDLFITTAFRKI